MNLKQKIIVITGASQGLGKSLAIKAAQQGAYVALVARSEDLLKKVKNTIVEGSGTAEYFVCDIRDLTQIQQTVSAIIKRFNTIDILINNAAMWTDEELERKDPTRRKDAFETNSLGQIQFTHEVLPVMRKVNSGHIFNIISTSGASDISEGDNQYWMTYGATKWAMRGFTKDLSTSLKNTKIKVTGFFPGGIDTNLYENAKKENAHNQPWMMQSDNIADIIVFTLTQPADINIDSIVVTKKME